VASNRQLMAREFVANRKMTMRRPADENSWCLFPWLGSVRYALLLLFLAFWFWLLRDAIRNILEQRNG